MAERGGGIGSADTSIYRVPETNPLGIANQAVALANQAQDLQGKQFGLQVQRLQQLNAHLGSLIADPEVQAGGPGAMKKITDVGGRLVALGIVPAKDLTVAIAGINPQNPIAALRQAQLNTLSAQERMNAVYGTPMVVNTGNQQQVVRQSPFMGGVAPMSGGQFQNQPGPGELLQRVQGPPDATGAPTSTSLGGISAREGALRPDMTLNTPGAAPAPVAAPGPANRLQQRATPAQGGLPVQPGTAPVGPAIPPPVQPQRGAAMPTAPKAMAQNGPWGSTPVGLPPGQAQAMQVTGEAAGQQLASDMAHAANITQKTYPLIQAVARLERLGTTGTGPGSESLNQVKSFIQTMGLPGFDPNKIKDFDEAKKYLTDYVNRQAGAGGVTNDKLAASFAGNPSVGISNAAASDVAKSALALERMRAAQATAFQESGKTPAEYQKWSSQWNATQDPRAYGADIMGPQKLAKLVKEIETKEGPEALSRFKASLAVAHRQKLLAPPRMENQ